MTTLPNFDSATFKPGAPIDNPYYPLKPGTIYVYEGEPAGKQTGSGSEELTQTAVTFETKNVAGVTASVVRDTAWLGGFFEEDTRDLYAQDTDGNVWYLGESTTEFEYDDNGNFIGTNNQGSWETGVNGAVPGYIMEAHSIVGDSYYQEFAPHEGAVDRAAVISEKRAISTESGKFTGVLQTLDTTVTEPNVAEFKYYAPGVGLILTEEGIDENLKPEFSSELKSTVSVTPEFFTSGRGTKGNDVLDGSDHSDTLTGYQGNDFLQGFGGKDQLLGQDGNDFLVGGAGADLLKGGNGDDILIGGQGADVLEGNKGRDQFVFRTLGDKGDLIKDFTRQDVIVLAEIFNSGNYGSSNPFADYLQINQVVSRAVIRIDPDGDTGSNPFEVLATLQNTNANSLTAANFVV